ncbi:MAG: peptide deformylase [Pirellulales bacterium]|nr:peptide deformylase [Pirellulales bacterium]
MRAKPLRRVSPAAYNWFTCYPAELPSVRIIRYPHPTLRHKSKPLRRVDAELQKMIRQMFDLMYEEEGIGLAANQVDLPYRLFVINVQSDPAAKDEEMVFINPVITQPKGTAEDREGCLSLPELYAPVRRPEKITISAYNAAGQEFSYQMDGLYARVVQHEYDHLDGILFIDRLTAANLLAVKEALGELEAEFCGERRRGIIPDEQQIAARLAELEGARA